jgi:hypothetical protein
VRGIGQDAPGLHQHARSHHSHDGHTERQSPSATRKQGEAG